MSPARLVTVVALVATAMLAPPVAASEQPAGAEGADAGGPAQPSDDGIGGDAMADDDVSARGDAPGDESVPETADVLSDGGCHYTLDLSDAELARRWKEDPASLGSVSVGNPEAGRLINAIPFPEAPDGGAWAVIVPESCWTTQETADAITGAAQQLREWFPDGAPVRVGQVSAKEGGYLPPHVTHQNGRDIDVGLFYPGDEPYRVREREKVMDVAMNWAFVKAILMHGDVQFILLDQRVQKVLYDFALKQGEDKAWLESLFHAGPRSIFHHVRKHRDHFHVRLYNPRAQELAHRLTPLMPVRPEENIAFHRVKQGNTLSGIALQYKSSVKMLKTANHLSRDFLKLGQVLRVPLRGPCTDCPVPPLVVVPPRRLPPQTHTGQRELSPARAPKPTAPLDTAT